MAEFDKRPKAPPTSDAAADAAAVEKMKAITAGIGEIYDGLRHVAASGVQKASAVLPKQETDMRGAIEGIAAIGNGVAKVASDAQGAIVAMVVGDLAPAVATATPTDKGGLLQQAKFTPAAATPTAPSSEISQLAAFVATKPGVLRGGIQRKHPELKPVIAQLQAALNDVGIKNEKGETIADDGEYGMETYAAVKSFQVANGLKVDGRWGPESQKKLDELRGASPQAKPDVTAAVTDFVAGVEKAAALVGRSAGNVVDKVAALPGQIADSAAATAEFAASIGEAGKAAIAALVSNLPMGKVEDATNEPKVASHGGGKSPVAYLPKDNER
jgi:peptidoglycan hydrolase-like protein with peptidoglycan-binding domain